MKYKKGDNVRIRKDLETGNRYQDEKKEMRMEFMPGMEEHRGKEAVVRVALAGSYLLTIDGENCLWSWTVDMFEEGDSVWDELSKTALNDEEGALYAHHLNPAFASANAAFSKGFWKKGIVPFEKEELMKNPHLTIDELVELIGDNANTWGSISRNRTLTIEEVLRYPLLQPLTICYENQNTLFKRADWKRVTDRERIRYQKGEVKINNFTLLTRLFPIDVIEKEWNNLTSIQKASIIKYHPITYDFVRKYLTMEIAFGSFSRLIQQNKLHTISPVQLKEMKGSGFKIV